MHVKMVLLFGGIIFCRLERVWLWGVCSESTELFFD